MKFLGRFVGGDNFNILHFFVENLRTVMSTLVFNEDKALLDNNFTPLPVTSKARGLTTTVTDIKFTFISPYSTVSNASPTSPATILNEQETDQLTTELRSHTTTKLLVPPECVYGTDCNGSVRIQIETGSTLTEIKLSPTDALLAWAKTHNPSSPTFEVLKGVDATNWSEKKKEKNKNKKNDKASSLPKAPENQLLGLSLDESIGAITTPDEMNFDWTYTTPYGGTFPSTVTWCKLDTSAIPIAMLMDVSQPILLYTNNPLFEDDMHDNGDVTLNVKLRVMPKCWYVKMRYYLRVDYVKIRVRETRIFGYIGGVRRIFRDVVWREADWGDLEKLGLPSDVKSWREPQCESLLNRVKVVDEGFGCFDF